MAEIPDSARAASIKAVIYATPIRNGRSDLDWNCQNWVGEALARLVDSGYVSAAQRDQALDKMIDVCMEAGDEPGIPVIMRKGTLAGKKYGLDQRD